MRMSGAIDTGVVVKSTRLVFVNLASVIAMLTELFTSESLFFATDASVGVKDG